MLNQIKLDVIEQLPAIQEAIQQSTKYTSESFDVFISHHLTTDLIIFSITIINVFAFYYFNERHVAKLKRDNVYYRLKIVFAYATIMAASLLPLLFLFHSFFEIIKILSTPELFVVEYFKGPTL